MKTALPRVVALLCLLASSAPLLAAPKIEADIVYGRKDGMALTFDLIRPEKPNGAAILWIPTGGWYSPWFEAKASAAGGKGFLDKGYTLFIVRHSCAPKYAIPDCVADVRRCVRFIRMKAKDYGVDPERLGVWGGSAGGHLSLMLGTTGDDGDPKSKDAVLQQSSRVAAVVSLYAPTDISTWVTDPPAEIKKHASLKPPLTFDAKLAPAMSPLLKVSARSAPTLLIHGDKDLLVPISHSITMDEALRKAKVECKLITIEGAAHGFTPKQTQDIILPAMMGWFEKHLTKKEG